MDPDLIEFLHHADAMADKRDKRIAELIREINQVNRGHDPEGAKCYILHLLTEYLVEDNPPVGEALKAADARIDITP